MFFIIALEDKTCKCLSNVTASIPVNQHKLQPIMILLAYLSMSESTRK